MEEDKKKKKNKKKKNKQDSKSTNGDATLSHQNNTSVLEDRIAGGLQTDAMQPSLDERERQIWLQKEAILEDKLKHIQIEKDSCIQAEVVLRKQLTDLQKEKDAWLQEEAGMDKKLKELLNERALWTLKAASLDDRIKQLENDKESSVLEENLLKETIAKMTKYEMEVQAQVKVLQESRDGLLQENQQLMETISYLQSQVQHLEDKCSLSASSTAKTEKDEDATAQIEAASLLVEKLITENAELVQKGLDPEVQVSETATVDNGIPEFCEMSKSEEKIDFPASIQTREKGIAVDHADSAPKKLEEINTEDYQEASETEEIVQIPLNENEIREVEVQDANEVGVPITDAPLTGAPFRLISFFARYVSGADLVKK